jgi:hypothetical protein
VIRFVLVSFKEIRIMTAYTPNLPALITALPGDHTRAAQTEFTRARQVLFLDNPSVTGSVRSAAASGGVSHQSAYRARRATGAFRTAWDAALVVARANAEAVLTTRAIDGVEEDVLYHGEVVATRRRYCSRLLLAHLARLDKLAETPGAAAFAADFDAALARFERGEEFVAPGVGEPSHEVPASAGTQDRSPALRPAGKPAAEDELPGGQAAVSGGSRAEDFSSPGPCNTRSMSYPATSAEGDEDHDIDWEDEEEVEAELDRIVAAMEADRPADAPRLTGKRSDGEDRDPANDPGGLIADAQWEAFARGAPCWWLVVPPVPPRGSDAWCYADLAALSAAQGEAAADEDEDIAEEEELETETEAELELKSDLEFCAQPDADSEPEPQPEPPLNRIVKPWPKPPMTWPPINDGRLQPYYGREY